MGTVKSLREVYRSPMGTTVWAIPGSELQILWAGPGASLRIGHATKAGGVVTKIDHPVASDHYRTKAAAYKAAKRFVSILPDAANRSRTRA